MLDVRNLHKTFTLQDGSPLRVLDDIGFHVAKGKFFTLLGPSGCGKTTTLRSLAGLETPDMGTITIGANCVFDSGRGLAVAPNKRQIGMVFQSYAIWPHMNVFENVAFPLRVGTRLTRREIARKVEGALETVELGGYGARPATKLSGGQQQRLALARALVVEPDLLLLDEPLSNLDAQLRLSMRVELRRLQRELMITTVFVTHDQTEALALSDEVAVMNHGAIVQIGDPQTIYHRPRNRFVASFIGSTNLIPATTAATPSTAGLGAVETRHGRLSCVFGEGARQAAEIVLSIRPECITLDAAVADEAADGVNRLQGRIRERLFVGETIDYIVAVNDAELRVRGNPHESFLPEQAVGLRIRPDHCLALPAQ